MRFTLWMTSPRLKGLWVKSGDWIALYDPRSGTQNRGVQDTEAKWNNHFAHEICIGESHSEQKQPGKLTFSEVLNSPGSGMATFWASRCHWHHTCSHASAHSKCDNRQRFGCSSALAVHWGTRSEERYCAELALPPGDHLGLRHSGSKSSNSAETRKAKQGHGKTLKKYTEKSIEVYQKSKCI